jgi:glutathione S-transferase
MVAHECSVTHDYRVVPDLLSLQASDYADNPALKLPILETSEGAWFGSLTISRELARRALNPNAILWPEAVTTRLAANTQELILQGMATEVALIMSTMNAVTTRAYDEKARRSLLNTLVWLDAHWAQAVAELPPARTCSFLEITAFCFVAHLEFRGVADIAPYSQLRAFCQGYAQRPSALATAYVFDAP